jgi:tetratricopeptide (TPR) repeat protein
LSHCIRLNLLEVEHNRRRYVIHPMTRAFARTQLKKQPNFEAESKDRCIRYFRMFVRETVTRENPTRRYWNALVSDAMLAIDPEWPSIQQMMAWADEAGHDDVLVDFVLMLVHYMDSRFHNFERLFYVDRAIAALRRRAELEEHQAALEQRNPDRVLLDQFREDEALLRIDTLGWTYVEENRLRDAYREILHGFQMAERLETSERNDLLALGYAWRARVLIEQNDATLDEVRIEETLSADQLIERALAIDSSAWIRTRVNMAAGDIALKQGNSNEALKRYEAAEAEAQKYGNEGRGYQTAPRIGLAYLAANRLDEAEKRFKELRDLEQIAIGKLYADYGLAMVAYKRGEIVGARGIIEATRTKLSRRTSSNLLLKLINKLYDDLELT